MEKDTKKASARESTHTIRRAGARKIVTFRPKAEAAMMAADPWAVGVVLSSFFTFLGPHHIIDSEQEARLSTRLELAKFPKDFEQHMALTWMANGFRILDVGLIRSIGILDQAIRTIRDSKPPAALDEICIEQKAAVAPTGEAAISF